MLSCGFYSDQSFCYILLTMMLCFKTPTKQFVKSVLLEKNATEQNLNTTQAGLTCVWYKSPFANCPLEDLNILRLSTHDRGQNYFQCVMLSFKGSLWTAESMSNYVTGDKYLKYDDYGHVQKISRVFLTFVQLFFIWRRCWDDKEMIGVNATLTTFV